MLLLGETVAGSQFTRNPVFNQNRPQLARSAFEIKNRIQLSLAREFEFVKSHKTSLSLYYEGRTGNPYTFVYSGDANGDGVNANDLVYVPTGTGDPVLAALTPAAASIWIMSMAARSENTAASPAQRLLHAVGERPIACGADHPFISGTPSWNFRRLREFWLLV